MLIILALVAIAAVLLTVGVINKVINNYYASGYFAISALFDAVGIDVTGLSSITPSMGFGFYEVLSVLALDGIIKIIIIGFIIATIVGIITNFDIRSRLSGYTLKKLKGHVIVCGYSGLAERVCDDLQSSRIPFVVIEKSRAVVDGLRDAGMLALNGDFGTEQMLRAASIENAGAVLMLAGDDYENLLGIIAAHHINSKIKIISRAKAETTLTKLHRAGAELCVVPEVLAGLEIGNYIVTKV